jgi:hypothetical protein
MFRCLLHNLPRDHCGTCSLLQCCYKMYNIPFFLNLQCCYSVRILSCILKILKMLVKILRCHTLISVGSRYLLCMLAIYVFTVSSCLGPQWCRISKIPHSCCCVVPLTPLEEQYNNRNKNAQCGKLKKIIINFVTEIIYYLGIYSLV